MDTRASKFYHGILTRIIAFICAVLIMMQPLPVMTARAEDELTGGIWTGFASCESSGEGARQAGGDSLHAYGLFQFDDRYDLIPFLGVCLSTDPEKYSGFQAIYNKYNGSSAIISSSSTDSAALIQAWHNAYDSDPEGFTSLQLMRFVSNYYPPCVTACAARGIDLNDDSYSPVIRGTLMSICIWAGSGGVKKVINRLSSGMTESEMLDACYSNFTAELKGANSKYIKGFRDRWTNTQKTMAAQAYSKWQSGVEIPTTDSSDLTSMLGGSGVMYAIDGGTYVDYIKAWIEKYPDITKEFCKGGWNTGNKEWAMSLRNAGDFYEMYGIVGNGVELDLSTGTSGGITIGDVAVNAENYSVPDNGGSMPIVYFSQSGGQPWSSVPFGGGNIASSGCSITSLSMVVSYLTGGTDKDSWVYPSDIVSMIQAKTGNYNHFYAGDSGQSWTIFPAVAGYYGLHCSQISESSIVSSLTAGKPVIMSCVAGEFTKKGHFIVLTGLTDDGYIVVNDPSHPDKSGKKYTANYIISQGKGWWAFNN